MRPDVTKKARNLRTNATEAEKLLWSKLNNAQLGVKFRRQHPVKPYILDFFCPERGLVIEVDGGQHADQVDYDAERTAILEQKGYKVLRFWNNEVLENIEGVLHVIADTLRALPPLSPLPQAGGGRDSVKKTSSAVSRRGSDKTKLPPPMHGRGDKGGRDSLWRHDFPILCGGDIAYLDSASSAQKPQAVMDVMAALMSNEYSNIHRGLYKFSQVTTERFEAVRGQVAAFIGASSDREIVFTRNATEAINLVAQSWARVHLRAGDEIILTEMEHHANIVPWQLLRDQVDITIKTIPVRDDGTLDLERFGRMLTPQTKMVSVVHVSNTLGTVNNVKKIIEIAKDFYPDMKVLIDGSQAVVHMPVDVQDLGCDFYVFTGHKLYGPTGIGVLWGKYDVLDSMAPYQGGGDMIEKVTFEQTTYKEPPARFEAGTPAIVEVIGLGAAIDYINQIGFDMIHTHETELLAYAMEKLAAIDGLIFYGNASRKAGIISFTADWGHPADIGTILDQCGVAVRTGHHCCQPLMTRLGVEATVRASLGLYSNKEDIDALITGLRKAKELLA